MQPEKRRRSDPQVVKFFESYLESLGLKKLAEIPCLSSAPNELALHEMLRGNVCIFTIPGSSAYFYHGQGEGKNYTADLFKIPDPNIFDIKEFNSFILYGSYVVIRLSSTTTAA